MARKNPTTDDKLPAPPAPLETFLRMPDVERATGLRRGFIYRLIQRGDFPAPFKLTPRASAWRTSEVAAWQATKLRKEAA